DRFGVAPRREADADPERELLGADRSEVPACPDPRPGGGSALRAAGLLALPSHRERAPVQGKQRLHGAFHRERTPRGDVVRERLGSLRQPARRARVLGHGTIGMGDLIRLSIPEDLRARWRAAALLDSSPWVMALALVCGAVLADAVLWLLPASGRDLGKARELGIVSLSVLAGHSKSADTRG